MTEYDTADYPDSTRERFVEEEPGRRNQFVRDRSRVLHCAALRRLAGKTQVLETGKSDVPRTRLTHSLEVAQVARELGGALGCSPDLVDLAALAHDLGHPPYGHNGEETLNDIAQPLGGFEGNAQTFRILTRLESKIQADGRSVGLNLTRGSLDAGLKYPWAPDGRQKYGVYDADLAVFEWVRQGAPPSQPALEAQVMDWADDVAYSCHDLDDAIQLEHFDPNWLTSPAEREAVIARAIAWYVPQADPEELAEALTRIRNTEYWVGGYDGSARAMAAVKQLTSSLIGRFCWAAEYATRTLYGPAPLARYSAELVVPHETRLEVAVLKAVAAHYVMLRPGNHKEYDRQRETIATVVEKLVEGEGTQLEPWARHYWDSASTDEERLRVILDQVASLTDASIARWYLHLAT